ncbi:glucan 1,3-beta-glucosidase [Cryptococcus wingfieldii CBS 7118]|uniref:glucan endo-1,3-beta-D-glucosidase n=1 Tax=Cryptococcus wingfieldii CBS 7118 TaxID=1295528 RepID=A0A1E3IY71_9TREE|nr:glucan 1,3-beta-glucosidase [Cryptococcus wingfieldii CBS 7118]ODN93554.1 glucan 1,3-beta-glucosidase [Cryptococcus wingfieldii CBS 7118]
MPMPMMQTPGPRPFTNPDAHLPIPSENYFPLTESSSADQGKTTWEDMAAQQAARKKKRLWIIAGVLLAVAAVAAIVIGVVVSQTNQSSDNDGSTNSGSNGTLTIGDDASVFEKDSRLHQSFWGFAYTPQSVLLPWCGAIQSNVTRDIQLLSQITSRIRLYGANCNQTAMVLQAIHDTKVNMTVWPAICKYPTAYDDQVTSLTDALKTYGTDHISGVTVGNEYILNTAGTDSTTSSTYLSAVSTITDKIAKVDSTIQGLGLDKVLPVGTSDAGSIMSKKLGEGVDYFMANVHPYFGSLAIDDAAAWTTSFFEEYDVDVAAEASNKPATYIAETGWPTGSDDEEDSNSGAGSPQGDASVANLQTFLDTFVCQANNNGTEYFYFEAFDEPWKAQVNTHISLPRPFLTKEMDRLELMR